MTNKKIYQSPMVEIVRFDNEISLTLDSSLIPWNDPELFSTTAASEGVLLGPELF